MAPQNFSTEDSQAHGNYDFGSIMHYNLWAFSSGGQTIAQANPLPAGGWTASWTGTIGQRLGLSDGDIAAANVLSGVRILDYPARTADVDGDGMDDWLNVIGNGGRARPWFISLEGMALNTRPD